MLKNKLLSAMGQAVPSDPNFANVSLLLHGDGTNGTQNNTFIDSSPNNFPITRNGNVTQGSFSPFPLKGAEYNPAVHGGSAYFPDDSYYLTAPSSIFSLSTTTNFTIEFWAKIDKWNTYNQFIGQWGNVSSFQLSNIAGTLGIQDVSGFCSSGVSTGSVPTGVWHHFAFVRVGSSAKMYLNGIGYSLGRNPNISPNTSYSVGIGRVDSQAGYGSRASMSSIRVVKGIALYTSNFTPPTTALTAVPNTSLLLNFTNGGIYDNAAKVNLETVGNAQVSTVQKKFGTGAMYFDGSGDYLKPSTIVLDTDFTVEFWAHRTTNVSSYMVVVSNGAVSGWLGWNGNNTTFTWDLCVTATVPDTINTWAHYAITKQGTTARIFVNGILLGSNTSATNTLTISQIGGYGTSYYFKGYIDDLRITKGEACYTANFTPPSAPFPNK